MLVLGLSMIECTERELRLTEIKNLIYLGVCTLKPDYIHVHFGKLQVYVGKLFHAGFVSIPAGIKLLTP